MKIVITAGGTSEKIDDVRTITNSSTGRLGYAVGTAFLQQYADELEAVYYLHGTRARHPEHEKVIPVEIGGYRRSDHSYEEIPQGDREHQKMEPGFSAGRIQTAQWRSARRTDRSRHTADGKKRL